MFRKLFSTLLVTLFFSAACHAGLVVSAGNLLGATGINISGSLYDVQFLDGSCILLFNGCDEPIDFTFNTEAGATAASQALLDQVFITDAALGDFDNVPGLTNGCDGNCFALTPWQVFQNTVDFVFAGNLGANDGSDFIESNSLFADFNVQGESFLTWAVWTPQENVPEPGSFILLLLGLTGLYFSRRRSI